MSNYVPWYGKKKARLERVEAKIMRLLAGGGDAPRLTRVAEELRAARVRVLRAELAQIPPCARDDNEKRRQALQERIAGCLALPIEEVNAEYNQRPIDRA